MNIALSVDFDFFVREDPMWDFGHEETEFYMREQLWNLRYRQYDLYKETSYDYADIHPGDFFDELEHRGFTFDEDIKIGSGWSHENAHDFFLDKEFDTLINVDAHNDCYEVSDDVNASNWLLKLKLAKGGVRAYWVVPKWVGDHDGSALVTEFPFKDIASLKGNITSIYLAHSPAWVPPHHDIAYKSMLIDLLEKVGKTKLDYDGQEVVRRCLTKEEAQYIHNEYVSEVKKMRKEDTGMNFLEAMALVIAGKMVSRKEWNDERTLICLHQKLLCIRIDKKYHSWMVGEDDVNATDYFEVYA